MSIKFIVIGTINVEVTAEIVAENEQDAKNTFDSADCCIESCDSDITFTDCSQSGSDIDEVKCPAADKWEELSRLDRAVILKENGMDEEEALEEAKKDYLYEIDEEYWEHFND